jgi:hypothetical protein
MTTNKKPDTPSLLERETRQPDGARRQVSRGESSIDGGEQRQRRKRSNVMAHKTPAHLPSEGMERVSPAVSTGIRSSQRPIRSEEEWTYEDVGDHFAEAFRTLRRLPSVKVQSYFNAWPEVLRTRREIAAMEPEPMRVWPSAAAISRLEQTFDWVLWIDEAERRLVWSRAARVPWKQISGELGCDRTTAWRRWQLALTKIAARLNAK